MTFTTIPTTSSRPTTETDEFDSPEFAGTHESLPYLQLLNHADPQQAGFFLTLENAEAVGFQPCDEWQPHTTRFQTGATVEGYRSLVARMLVLRRSNLLMFDRESGEFLGLFQKSRYDRNTVVLKIRYLVFLVGRQKQLLHDTPLLLTTKGSFCGGFGETYRQFRQEMSQAFGTDRGTRQPRGDKFMALAILAVRVQPELRGKERKSWTCAIASYGQLTVDNWKGYFVGYEEATKLKVYAALEEWAEFGSLEREAAMPAQQSPAASPSEPDYGYDDESDFVNYGSYANEF
jgi:Family of unknown function (DUF5895)